MASRTSSSFSFRPLAFDSSIFASLLSSVPADGSSVSAAAAGALPWCGSRVAAPCAIAASWPPVALSSCAFASLAREAADLADATMEEGASSSSAAAAAAPALP